MIVAPQPGSTLIEVAKAVVKAIKEVAKKEKMKPKY